MYASASVQRAGRIPATLVVGLGLANSTSEMAGVLNPHVNVPGCRHPVGSSLRLGLVQSQLALPCSILACHQASPRQRDLDDLFNRMKTALYNSTCARQKARLFPSFGRDSEHSRWPLLTFASIDSIAALVAAQVVGNVDVVIAIMIAAGDVKGLGY